MDSKVEKPESKPLFRPYLDDLEEDEKPPPAKMSKVEYFKSFQKSPLEPALILPEYSMDSPCNMFVFLAFQGWNFLI